MVWKATTLVAVSHHEHASAHSPVIAFCVHTW